MTPETLLEKFTIPRTFLASKANTQGHINSTFVCSFLESGGRKRYILQKINRLVFHHPEEVMENILLVTNWIRRQLKDDPEADRKSLCVIPSREGKPYVVDEEGGYWRVYPFIERSKAYEKLADARKAYQFGSAVGRFHNLLSTLDGHRLSETIPHFHDMGMRYRQLEAAMRRDPKGRLATVGDEIGFLMERRRRGCVLWDGMEQGVLPLHITHNDTKLDNVLFDEDSGEVLCLIDLDTVMPGTVLFDTGDMLRTASNTAEEDERDLEKVDCDTGLFQAILAGYQDEATFLTGSERSLLAESGIIMTQIMAVRFLSDYLAGDVYYHIDRPGHNLDRARCQIALIRAMEAKRSLLHG